MLDLAAITYGPNAGGQQRAGIPGHTWAILVTSLQLAASGFLPSLLGKKGTSCPRDREWRRQGRAGSRQQTEWCFPGVLWKECVKPAVLQMAPTRPQSFLESTRWGVESWGSSPQIAL